MKTSEKNLTLLLIITLFSSFTTFFMSCGGNDDDNTPASNINVGSKQSTNNKEDDESNDPAQMILGTWKCNTSDGYTIITFKENGQSEWKYQLDDDISRWTFPYEITAQYLYFEEDGIKNSYTYTLTATTLSFDDDEYVKVDNYVEEDDPTNYTEVTYDNRGAVAKQFRGDGTKANPYIISDATELRKLADDVESGKTYRDEYFKMTADVVINKNVANYQTGVLTGNVSTMEQWKPIGKNLIPFCGTFDGNGHTISGIFIQHADKDSLGLFGSFAGTLTNLTIKDSYIEGRNGIGGLVGNAKTATYSKDYYPSISLCVGYAVVKGNTDGMYHGGIVGLLRQGSIQKCANYGYVKGYKYVGGIIGNFISSTASDCANYGTITGELVVAGIAGNNASTNINSKKVHSYVNNCVNFGDISASKTVGGITGTSSKSGDASNIVNYGKIQILSEKQQVGALSGFVSLSDFSNGYFLETSYPIGIGVINSVSQNNIQSMTKNQMQAQTFLAELNKNAKALGNSYSQWGFGKDEFPTLLWIK